MELPYIKIFTDALETWSVLSNYEVGCLVRALLQYQRTGQEPADEDFEGNEWFLFPTCKAQIDRDNETYRATCSSRSDAGKKGAKDPCAPRMIQEWGPHRCDPHRSAFGRRGVLLHLSGLPCQYQRRVAATKLTTSNTGLILCIV